MKVFQSLAVIYFSLSSCIGQQDEDYPEYQDYADPYQQDNLYADYAARQEMKDRYVLHANEIQDRLLFFLTRLLLFLMRAAQCCVANVARLSRRTTEPRQVQAEAWGGSSFRRRSAGSLGRSSIPGERHAS